METRKTKTPFSAQGQEPQVFRAATSLPSAVATQWQFGDWASLQAITLEQLEAQEGRAQLAGMVAVAHFQQGDPQRGKQYLAKAREWGCSRALLARLMTSGMYNTLGRSALLSHQHERARQNFHQSVAMGTPGADLALLTPARIAHQAMQLGIPLESVDNWNLLMPCDQQGAASLIEARDTEEASESPLIRPLMQHLDTLAQKMANEGREMTLDGVHVFHEKNPFLPGKVALGLAYWVTEYPPGSAITFERCRYTRQITQMLLDKPVQSWGIDFYLRALHKLNQAGLLEKCLSQSALVQLQQILDWRDFVDERDYSLKHKPNNFYGVAYSIAYHRYQLGWDDFRAAEHLLDRIVEHYRASAGEFGFADETEGHGRYDRYSLLLIAEIAHHHREAGLPLIAEMRKWLRASVDVVLVNLNEGGHGFQYGRSIGAYGDSAFIEILAAAAWFDVLEGDEPRMAYHFCCLATEKFLSFWWDDKRQSVNLWEEGRATEAYRGKHRILGESLTLLHQHLYTQHIWQKLGFYEADRDPQAFREWLGQLPTSTLTWFEKGKYEYALLTWRDGDRIFNVPLVNGHEYHALSTYLPIPYSHNLIQGVPDLALPLLMPTLQLEDGQQLAPLCWFQQIKCWEEGEATLLQWYLPYLASAENGASGKENCCQAEVQLRLASGSITARCAFIPRSSLQLASVVMQRLVSSNDESAAKPFINGNVDQLEAIVDSTIICLETDGFDYWETTKSGSQDQVRFKKNIQKAELPLVIKWQLKFKWE